MSADIRRPQRLNLTQQCAESIKEHIVRSALKPGDRLPTEQEWVEMLGVSRLVVREALHMLAGSGMIEVQQGRGAFVRDGAEISLLEQLLFGLDAQHLTYSDVFEARAMLDLVVLELCMHRADQHDFDDLERILQQMQETIAKGERNNDNHIAFHRRLLQATGNPLIERLGLVILDMFWRMGEHMPSLRLPEIDWSAYDEVASHRALLEAIRSRDLANSRRLVFQHLPVQPGVTYYFPIAATPDVTAG